MKGIVKLAVFAALLYLGYTRAMPWLERLQLSKQEESVAQEQGTASADCVALARTAANTLGSELIPLAAPTADRGTWGTALLRTGAALSDADDACRCGTESCLQASVAISEMRRTVDSLNSAVRGSGPPMASLAHSRERVDQLLNEAQRLVKN
ncbi:MAG: hypothetical protein OES47_05720 [Acidobacteriota bacterium]|nr:hypothetical protein [Acidobacteriota bacterium]